MTDEWLDRAEQALAQQYGAKHELLKRIEVLEAALRTIEENSSRPAIVARIARAALTPE